MYIIDGVILNLISAGRNFFGIKKIPKENAFKYPDQVKMPGENFVQSTSKEIILFDYENMNKEIIPVRTVIINDLPWWVAKDVCTAFGIVNHKRTVSDLIENYKEIQMDIDEVRKTYPIPDALGRPQETTIIREAGVYALAFQSRKKEALRFQHWVTSKVLPSIRKTDGNVQPKPPTT